MGYVPWTVFDALSLTFRQDTLVDYEAYLTGRMASLVAWLPAPALGAPRWKWNEFLDQRKLRLEEGDTGYIPWMVAKHALLVEVEEAFREAFIEGMFADELGNPDNSDVVCERLDWIVESFPVDARDL